MGHLWLKREEHLQLSELLFIGTYAKKTLVFRGVPFLVNLVSQNQLSRDHFTRDQLKFCQDQLMSSIICCQLLSYRDHLIHPHSS